MAQRHEGESRRDEVAVIAEGRSPVPQTVDAARLGEDLEVGEEDLAVGQLAEVAVVEEGVG